MADTKQQWYKDAKYGLFIHWGLYSILAGEWKDPKTGEVTKTDRIAEWIENNLNIDKEDYRKLKDEFHPDKFDADMFVKRAKEQWGVKYIVLTSKHHEGFAMYDSKVSDFNVVKAAGRDILRELSDACKKYDMTMGICDKEGNPMVWEACFTMNNNWGYCANDHYYKPASMLIKKLVECVSKGGNMILNVGPDAKGKFPKESSAILAEIGRWMDKNHDSIYGCVPAENIPKPDYGRITRNGNKYYVHIYENTLGPLPLLGFDKDKIVKVRALDDGHEVPISNAWMHSDYPDIAFVDLGPDPVLPDPVDYVLEVEMAE